MDLACPACSAVFEVPEEDLPPEGTSFKCSNCGSVFEAGPEGPSRRWVVRHHTTGRLIGVPEQPQHGSRDPRRPADDEHEPRTDRSWTRIQEAPVLLAPPDRAAPGAGHRTDPMGIAAIDGPDPRPTPALPAQPARELRRLETTRLTLTHDDGPGIDVLPDRSGDGYLFGDGPFDDTDGSPRGRTAARGRAESRPRTAARRRDEDGPGLDQDLDLGGGPDTLARSRRRSEPDDDDLEALGIATERRRQALVLGCFVLVALMALVWWLNRDAPGETPAATSAAAEPVGSGGPVARAGSGAAAEPVAEGSAAQVTDTGVAERDAGAAPDPAESRALAAPVAVKAQAAAAAGSAASPTRPPAARAAAPVRPPRDLAPTEPPARRAPSAAPGGSRFDGLLATGARALAAGKPDDALSAYATAADIRPASEEAQTGVGRAFAAMGRHDLAKARFTRVVTSSPRFVPAWLGLAEARRATQDNDGAIQAYREVLRLVPSGSSARQARAALERLGATP